jgi:DNA-binding XRE family transcriptional regulator
MTRTVGKPTVLRMLPKKATPESWRRRYAIAEKLRKRREDLGLSRIDAADRAGVSVDVWTRWETGVTAIPLELVATISSVVGNQWLPDIRQQLVA